MSVLDDVKELLKNRDGRTHLRKHFRYYARLAACAGIFRSVGVKFNRALLPFFIEYRPDFHYEFRKVPEYAELFEDWIADNVTNNCGDLTRFYMLYQNVSHVLDTVPGDLVELGVYKGNSAKVLAMLGRRRGRHTYLFDTFAGFDSRDYQGPDVRQRDMFTDTSLMTVQDLVGRENVTFVKGFFPESTSQIQMPTQLAVAHIDCDLYEPMKAGLETFYPLLASGGLVIMHDYGSGFWPGATQAVDEFFAARPEKPVLMPDKSGTAIVRKVL